MNRTPIPLLVAVLLSVAVTATAEIAPGEPVDYAPLAFQPKTWTEKNHDTHMLPWPGREIVFLTTPGDYDRNLMEHWVRRLDDGWALYADLTGARPRPFKQLHGKATIAAVPDGFTCGAGCGYIGVTGIELAMFYHSNYPALKKNPDAMPHYVFYEMGRNFYTFGDRHSCFITGFAVFMRYVCMDSLQCADDDLPTRRVIEQAEALVAKSDLPFLRAFTNADGLTEKEPRLKVNPSDQPVTYASAMMRLYRENGGNDWLRRFFRALASCKGTDQKKRAGALQQCWNWYICASLAAGKDLAPVFVDQWRLPVAAETRRCLAAIDWRQPGLTPEQITERVKPVWSIPVPDKSK